LAKCASGCVYEKGNEKKNITRITLNPADTFATINPNIYGHFAEPFDRRIYDAFWSVWIRLSLL